MMSLELLSANLNCLTESAEIELRVQPQEVDNSNIPYIGLLRSDLVLVIVIILVLVSRSYCRFQLIVLEEPHAETSNAYFMHQLSPVYCLWYVL